MWVGENMVFPLATTKATFQKTHTPGLKALGPFAIVVTHVSICGMIPGTTFSLPFLHTQAHDLVFSSTGRKMHARLS